MSWIYAFTERNERRYTKLGYSKEHYHERFKKTLQCNPIPLEIGAAWKFATSTTALSFERELKRRRIFPKWASGGPEWYGVSLDDIFASREFSQLACELGGKRYTPEAFSGTFMETLNIGTKGVDGQRFKPHLYLVAETPNTGVCKLTLSSYNWPTVAAHYMTYNPRNLEIVDRWTLIDETTGKRFFKSLIEELSPHSLNPLGWFSMDANEMMRVVAEKQITRYPRTSPIDDRVHYTNYRIACGP